MRFAWGWALLAGAALGWLFLTRPLTAMGIGLPFGLWAMAEAGRGRPGARLRLALLLAGGLPFVAGLLLYNGALTGDPFLNSHELYWAFDRLGFGPGIGMSAEGHTPERGLWNTLVNLQELQMHLFGWPGQLTLAFALVPFVTGRARRWDWLLLLMFASLVGAHIFWWAEGIMYGPRYYYEGLAALVLLTARGVEEVGTLLGWVVQRWRRCETRLAPHLATASRLWRPNPLPCGEREATPLSLNGRGARGEGTLAAHLLVALLIVYNAVGYLPMQARAHRGYNYVNGEVLRAVKRAGLSDALVFVRTDQPYAWWTYGSVFSANSPLLDTSVVYAQDLGVERNRQVIRHFPGRTPYLLHGTVITSLEGPDGSGR